ncbi:MAG: peptide deformylase [Candidatus Eremiobacterota bacterium]
MAVREIVLYPDPVLKRTCRPVEDITPEIESLLDDLVDTMRDSPGVGLAAPQLGQLWRAIVVDVTPRHPGHGLLLLINPEIVLLEGSKVVREGCLSIPEFTASVLRAERCVVRALDRHRNTVVYESSGLEAICLQHEVDHLDGVLFLDRVACLKTDVFGRKGVQPRFRPEDHPILTGGQAQASPAGKE